MFSVIKSYNIRPAKRSSFVVPGMVHSNYFILDRVLCYVEIE